MKRRRLLVGLLASPLAVLFKARKAAMPDAQTFTASGSWVNHRNLGATKVTVIGWGGPSGGGGHNFSKHGAT